MNNTGTTTETVNQPTLTISEEPKLSRLQKLILTELVKKEDGSAWITTISLAIADSHVGKDPNRTQGTECMILKPTYRASFSRSVRHLKQRGLVKTRRFSCFDDMLRRRYRYKELVLTERGKNVAQKLKEVRLMAQSAGFGAPSTRRCSGDDRGGFNYLATSPRNQRAQKGGRGK